MQGKVCLLKCKSYDEKKVEEAVRESIRLLGGIRSFICPGDRVLLKINLLSAHPPERAVTTHPALVKAVVRIVKDVGAKPFIGDSCGVAYKKEDAMGVWEKTGIARVAREERVEIVNFQQAKEVKNPRGKPPFLYIAKEAMETDAVFSLPKLKTHTFTLFTGAIKNMYGTVPGFWKKDLHARFPRPKDFAKVVVDLFSLVFPKLSIMDGIVGMEGKGPSAGSPRKIGLVITGADPVAVDAVASTIIGFNPLSIEIIREAFKRGLGEARIEKIEIVGEELACVKVDNFELVSGINTLLNNMPYPFLAVGKLFFSLFFKVEPSVDKEKCRTCLVCALHCPAGAIEDEGGSIRINRKKCIRCFCCQEFCPQGAIKIRHSFLAKRTGV